MGIKSAKKEFTTDRTSNFSDCAPRGQNMPAQGEAMGIMDLCNQSPEGVTHPLHPRSILSERHSTLTSGSHPADEEAAAKRFSRS
jgi:hypothetical protein